jgi:hypothetical protein
MKFLKVLIFIALIFNSIIIKAQQVDKISGVCFRIDDVQTPSNLRALDSVFSKHGKHFTYAPNPQIANYTQTNEFWSTLKLIQSKGNEIGDHSPNHYTQFFDVSNADSNKFKNRKGIDHIKIVNNPPVYGTRVCLKYNVLDGSGIGDESNVDIKNNIIISKLNGEFSNQKIYGNVKSVVYFYLPTLNQVVGFHGFKNSNSNDPDTANIRTFWNEEIDLGTINNIPYKKLSNYDVEVDKDGFRIMLQFSLDIFKSKGVNAPTVWIQPGGETPYLSKKYISDICGDEFGYKSGATYPGSIKGFNEADYERNKAFNMQWQDFQEENQTVEQIKNIIVDRFARHTLSFGSNHLGVFGANFPVNTIINNIDQILGWCVQNNIPVYTYSEWSNLIYKSQTNPENNILPPLQNDLDKDGKIDGYNELNGLDTLSGISQSNYRALTAFSSKTMFQITRLSGVETGLNNISLYAKGNTGNKVSFYIDFPEISKFVQFELPTSTSNYSYQNFTFNVPKGVSFLTVVCNSQISSGSLTISGMSLKGVNKPYVKLPILKRMANENFTPINLKKYTVDKFNSVDNIQWSVINNSIFKTSINTNSDLTLNMNDVTNEFWVGKDSIQIVAKSVNSSDTVWLNILSIEPRICADQQLVIKYNSSSIDSLLIWSSLPVNSNVSINTSPELIVYPNINTNYLLKVIKRGGAIYNHSINVNVVPTVFTGNTIIPRGFQSNNDITIAVDIPFYSSGLVTQKSNRPYLFIHDNEINFTKGTFLGNDTLIYKITTKSCETNTLTIITSEKNIGINDFSKNNLLVYPNPFNNNLTIEFEINNGVLDIEIIDILGNVFIKKKLINEKVLQLNTDLLAKGVYLIKIKNNETRKTYFEKIVKF